MRQDLRLIGEDVVQTGVAVCLGCRHARGTDCGIDGQSIPLHARAIGCPEGLHPDHNGHVTRMGVKHVGVPWLVRVWRWSEARDERWLRLPGCGCVMALKAAWLNLRARVSAWR